ncbi:MAG: DCL family protein [Candidatus Cloacimonadales bacterium]|nr:DCL family protein [Candidatus Cloacimonadales bacterium]
MSNKLEIGEKIFATKKDALNHFKTILNSYDFGEKLNQDDFKNILELLETHPKVKEKIGVGIECIRIARLKYNTKSFELVRTDNSTEYFSYTKRINAPKTYFTKFSEACRQAIQKDLRNVKLAYFDKFSKKGQVKCQETGELLKYEDLTVDHRQPNTFSIIVDRFIEVYKIDIQKIEYLQVDGGSDELADEDLKQKFREYHKDKSNLRIVKKSLNLGRSFQARVKRMLMLSAFFTAAAFAKSSAYSKHFQSPFFYE